MTASVLALIAAAFYGANPLAVQRALERSTPFTVVLISSLLNIAGMWSIAFLTTDARTALQPSALIFLGAGILAPALSQVTHYSSFPMIGVARAVIAGNTMPIFAALGAILFLHERATLPFMLGTLAVVGGVSTIAPQGSERSEAPRNRLGILLALAAALCTAASAIVRKIGFQFIPQVPLGAALTMTGSMVILGPLVILRRGSERIALGRSGFRPLLMTSLCTTCGQLAYFLALSLGEVSRVTLLINSAPIFTLVLLRFAFRGIESVTWKTAVGAGLTIAGVIVVATG